MESPKAFSTRLQRKDIIESILQGLNRDLLDAINSFSLPEIIRRDEKDAVYEKIVSAHDRSVIALRASAAARELSDIAPGIALAWGKIPPAPIIPSFVARKLAAMEIAAKCLRLIVGEELVDKEKDIQLRTLIQAITREGEKVQKSPEPEEKSPCRYNENTCPMPARWFIDGNHCGDAPECRDCLHSDRCPDRAAESCPEKIEVPAFPYSDRNCPLPRGFFMDGNVCGDDILCRQCADSPLREKGAPDVL